MTQLSRLVAGFRHGLRVRIGPTRARGVLLHCEKRGGGKYWRVRLQTGEWLWPDASIVVEGPGDVVGEACASCGLPYLMPTGSGELICASCSAEQFGGAARSNDPPPQKRWNQRRRWR